MPVASTLIDAVIAVTVAEILGLVVYHRLTGRGIAPRHLLPNAGAGVFLMLAARAGLADLGWQWLALCLAAAGAAHAIDLVLRWNCAAVTPGFRR